MINEKNYKLLIKKVNEKISNMVSENSKLLLNGKISLYVKRCNQIYGINKALFLINKYSRYSR